MKLTNSTLILIVGTLLVLQACAVNGELSAKKRQDAAQYNAELGAQYLQRGDREQAQEKLLKALEQDDSNSLAHITYANLQSIVGKPASAEEHFEKGLSLDPEEADYRNSYGIFLCSVKKYDEALEQFRTAADNPYYRTPEYALDNAGLCMLDADRLDDAESYLREALRINPKFANAYLHMADLMHRKQRLTVSDAYFQRFNAYGDESAESLLLGLQIKRDAGDLAGAQEYAERLLNQFPASQEAGEYLSLPIQ